MRAFAQVGYALSGGFTGGGLARTASRGGFLFGKKRRGETGREVVPKKGPAAAADSSSSDDDDESDDDDTEGGHGNSKGRGA